MYRFLLVSLLCFRLTAAPAQQQEIQQLLLNWEKLTQFKTLLQQMKDSWTVLQQGYTHIKSIASGNFLLHQAFLDALLEVSPVVRRYHKVAAIIQTQVRIIQQSKLALHRFRQAGTFGPTELGYLEQVFRQLLQEGLQTVEELTLVLTAGQLRMNEAERLHAIDRLHAQLADQFSFLQDFTQSASALSLQRTHEHTDVDLSRRLRGY